MYQTSAAYNEMIGRETRTFLARITFDDESVIDNGIRQATVVSGSCGAEMFTAGAAFSGYASLTIIDPAIDLTDQEFLLEIGLVLDDESIEYVPQGRYRASVADITRTKHSVTLTAWDRLARAGGQVYTPTVTYPCTAGDVLDDISNQTGLVFDLTAYPGIRDMEGFSAAEGTLISSVIGSIAGQKGGFAYADRNGNVALAPYGETACEQISANQCLDEIFLADNPVTMDAGGEITAYEYYPGIVRFMGDPRLEPIDLIEIEDADEVVRQIPCMNIILTFDGGTTTTIQAPAQARSDVNWGPLWNALEQTQDMAEAAETAANNAMIAANGKNKIFYQDAAPASGMSEGDLWFDTDGGNAVYEYKKVSSNPASYSWTLRQFGTGSIAAGSITANEINVANLAAITAYLGNAVIGGEGNTSGVLTVKDASGNTIGTWTKDGIDSIAGTIGPFTITPDALYYGLLTIGTKENVIGESETSVRVTSSYSDTLSSVLTSKLVGIQKYAEYSPFEGDPLEKRFLSVATLEEMTDYTVTPNRHKGQLKLHNVQERTSKVGINDRGVTLSVYEDQNKYLQVEGNLALYGTTVHPMLLLRGTTYNKNTYASNDNPRIDFHNSDESQNIALIFTDYDAVQAPASLTLAGNQGGEYFIAPNIKATNYVIADSLMQVGSGYPSTGINKGGISVLGASGAVSYVAVYGGGVNNGNQIYLQCETDGQVTLGSRGANSTWYTILKRRNNVHAIDMYGDWYVNTAIILQNNHFHYYRHTDGTNNILCGVNNSNHLFFGYGGYSKGSGITHFDGDTVYVRSKKGITFYPNSNTGIDVVELTSGGNLYVGSANDSTSHFVAVRKKSKAGSMIVDTNNNFGLWCDTNSKWLIYINSSGTVIANTSDIRYKENISNMPESDALSILREVDIINFSYKEDEQHTMQSGVSAQQLRDVVLKHGIKEHAYLTMGSAIEGNTDVYTDLTMPEEKVRYEVDYSKFVPILWKGWQYQDKRIRELEAEIDRLRERMKAS